MMEVDSLDAVGRALDEVHRRGFSLSSTLGRHTNDKMVSFYVRAPGGWDLEYGYDGMLVDEAYYTAEEITADSYWGHDWSGLRAARGVHPAVGLTVRGPEAETCDVLVVGFGCAGAAAAIEAAEAGASVIVLERASAPGGSSALSGGELYLGGGTALQQACGFEDSAEAMFAFLLRRARPARRTTDKLRAYCDGSASSTSTGWSAHGVPFKPSPLRRAHLDAAHRRRPDVAGRERLALRRRSPRPRRAGTAVPRRTTRARC